MYKFNIRNGNYVPPDASTGLPWSQRPPTLPRFTCGLAPQTLVKFFAAVDILKNILGILVFIYIYIKMRSTEKDEMVDYYSNNIDMQDFLNLPDWQQRGVVIFMVILFIIALIFSIVLYRGAKQANYTQLRAWFLFQLLALISFSAVHIWMFIHGWLMPERPRKLTGSLFLIFFLNYLWAGYSMYVTYLFMKDISYFLALNYARNTNQRFHPT